MIASDPLSYIFLGCFLFAAFFLIITTVLGIGHGHILGAGGHGLHLPHLGGSHLAGHVAAGHAPAHVATSPHSAQITQAQTANAATTTPSVGSTLKSLFLGSLNLYGLLILLLLFGLLGYLLHNFTNLGAELSLLVALIVGVLGAVLVSSLLSAMFFDQVAGALGADSSQLEGRLGKTSMAIRANGIGEVIYTTEQGSRQSMGARSIDGETIPADTDIVILGSRKGIASVQAWDRFMAEVRAGNAPPLEPIESE
jgi:hypothetical protein